MNVYDAKIPASESVEGIMKVIDKVTIQDSGKFLTNEGGTLPRLAAGAAAAAHTPCARDVGVSPINRLPMGTIWRRSTPC